MSKAPKVKSSQIILLQFFNNNAITKQTISTVMPIKTKIHCKISRLKKSKSKDNPKAPHVFPRWISSINFVHTNYKLFRNKGGIVSSLAVCVLMTWIVIIVLTLIPKKLSEIEMVFVYFTNTVFELSIFTILHINLEWIHIDQSVEKSLADLVLRLFMFPLVFVMTANILLYRWRILKFVVVILINLSFLFINFLMKNLGILKTTHWNYSYTILLFMSYTIFSSLMALFILNIKGKEVVKKWLFMIITSTLMNGLYYLGYL